MRNWEEVISSSLSSIYVMNTTITTCMTKKWRIYFLKTIALSNKNLKTKSWRLKLINFSKRRHNPARTGFGLRSFERDCMAHCADSISCYKSTHWTSNTILIQTANIMRWHNNKNHLLKPTVKIKKLTKSNKHREIVSKPPLN